MTGGGTGLGKATALELARCGAAVVIAGRRAEVLEGAAAEIGAARRGSRRRPCDRRRRARAGAGGGLIATVLERYGRLDLLVNNAGGQYFTPAEGIAAKGWRAVWRLNVDGMLNMAEAAFARAMRPAGRGTIVNVTLSPHHGMPGMAHSGSARATVEALTASWRERWADGRRRRDGGRGGALRDGGAREVPGEPARWDGAHGAAAAPRHGAGARLARGAARLAARAGRSTDRRSRSTARATTGSARGRRRGWRTRRGRCRPRSGKVRGRLRSGRLRKTAVGWVGLRAKCCGCTEAFQASRAGSIPVARSLR